MPQSCTSARLYDSVKHCDGDVVLSGIRQRVLYIPKADIVTWPTLPNVGGTGIATMNQLASYAGNFVLAADKYFFELDTLTARDNVTSEATGDKPSRVNNNQATLVLADTEEYATGFARQANNDDFVYLVQQRNGKFRMIGNEMFQTDTQVGIALGEGETGEVGTTLTIASLDLCPAPFYPGEIQLADGKISGADGSAIVENG